MQHNVILLIVLTTVVCIYYLLQTQFEVINKMHQGERQIQPKRDRITSCLEIKKNVVYITYFTVSPGGRRLGNHIFNVVSLLGIAERNNMMPFLFLDNDVLKNMDVDIKLFKHDCFAGIKHFHFREKISRVYDNRTENLTRHFNLKGNSTALIFLHGYFQTWKYFYEDRSRVVNIVKFKPKTKNEATVTIQNLLSSEKFKLHMQKNIHDDHTSCKLNTSKMGTLEKLKYTFVNNKLYCSNVKIIGIHVRRGDFLQPPMIKAGFVPPKEIYYKHAIEYIKKNYYPNDFILILICSDDIEWSKRHLDGDNVMFSDHQNRTAIMDLMLLSLCDSVVMSFSSYSFWGAYFSGGPSLYYKESIKPNSHADRECNKAEFLLPKWIGIV